MTSNLSIFNFEGQDVRFVGTAEVPEWIAQDVCDVLGIGEARNVMRNYDEEERGVYTIHGSAGKREVLTVKEPGLYRLIFKSRKPKAKIFKKWIAKEVLPSIRKTGNYSITESAIAPKTETPDFQSIGTAIDTVLGNTGVNPSLIAGVKANEIARLYPVLSETMEAAKKLLQVPVEEKPVTVTEIAKLFSEKHGLQTNAREINLLITDWGFQVVVMDGKKKTYKPTKKGEPHAQMILQAGRGSNKTVTQLKWYTSLIDALS
ncbi:MAG: hypothetical protein F6K55_06125 [Moorea sp. SIO4A3]|nr:hypothetical protein [Moorena sp. SIO4A3]